MLMIMVMISMVSVKGASQQELLRINRYIIKYQEPVNTLANRIQMVMQLLLLLKLMFMNLI